MKTKKTSKTNTRSRIIFFAIALTYNLLLGLYLKDFLVLSPMFTTFYILSVLPMLFLLVDTRSKIMIQAFYHWMIQNFEYDYEADPLIQYFDIRRTLRTRKGLCFDFSHLFAAFCRSQNIPCYVIDGMSRTDGADLHTWNRVYYNGSWWNMDVTHDITYAANSKNLYGFHELESISAFDEAFFITKIY